MSSILQDVRYALRALLQNKGFAAVAIVTLAIGIGVNTAIFSIVNAVVLRPLPFPNADRLMVVYQQHPAPVNRRRLSSENFLDLQRESRAFDALGGDIGTGFTFSSGTPKHGTHFRNSTHCTHSCSIRPGITPPAGRGWR